MISRIYYTIWSDCIRQIKTVPSNKSDWKFITMTTMSFLMGVNLAFLLLLISSLIIKFTFTIDIDILPGTSLDAALSFFLTFILPMMMINYFLIFKNDRYLTFVDKYKFYNGQYFKKYMLGSLLIPLGVLLISMLYVNFF